MQLVPANYNGKYGYIDSDGNIIIIPQYIKASYFKNGYAVVNKKNTYYYINEKNERVSPNFEEAYPFSDNGLALVKAEGKYFYINKQGIITIEVPFLSSYMNVKPSSFIGEYAPVIVGGSECHLLNSSGEIRKIPAYDFYGFYEGIARIKPYHYSNYRGNVIGYIDSEFRLIYKGANYGNDFNNGFAIVTYKSNSRFGSVYINSLGEELKLGVGQLRNFLKEGFAPVGSPGKWVFIDQNNNVIKRLSKLYLELGDYQEGLCPVKIMGFWGYIDIDGDVVIPAEFRKVYPFYNSVAKVVHKNGESLINKEGKLIWGAPLPY